MRSRWKEGRMYRWREGGGERARGGERIGISNTKTCHIYSQSPAPISSHAQPYLLTRTPTGTASQESGASDTAHSDRAHGSLAWLALASLISLLATLLWCYFSLIAYVSMLQPPVCLCSLGCVSVYAPVHARLSTRVYA